MTGATSEQRRAAPSTMGDDIAYVLPMVVFLVFTWIGGQWPSLYVASYFIKTIATAALLICLRKHYTRISWRWWWLGLLLGVLGLAQWVGMELFILHHWPNYPRLSHDIFIPSQHFRSAGAMWSFIILRWAGASLVVPFMEELFWRDFLWRSIIAPNDFKLADIGEWDWKAFTIVAVIFGIGVHIEWATAIVWGLMIGLLLVRTRSLGACIIMHATTNFLLGAYVLKTGEWRFW